jgi:ferredoxin/flavodoxin---NADP+ reductase
MALAPDKFYSARIIDRRDVAADSWVIRVDPGGDFQFVAGQYATLGVPVLDTRIERPYTIVSSPYEPQLEFFLEDVPHGELTPLLYKLSVGAELTLRKSAKGRFTLDLRSGHRNHLLLCTVTGVAPYISYIRTLHADWKRSQSPADVRLFVIQAASRSWEFGYREELERTAAEVPWLTYVPSVSRPWEDPSWQGERGRVDDLIRKYADQWQLAPSNTTAYLCGNPMMVEKGIGILERAGFPKISIKQEVYWQAQSEAAITR